ncbi:MAG: S41 family peptidase [Thermoflexales bacterium]|nr:S41 family peptidase [Thermoflexales bacterium]
MERPDSIMSNPIKNIALGMLGMFIGALIFILGMTAGVVMSRPGGLLFAGASPFSPHPSNAAVSAAQSDAATEQQGLNYALINDVIRRLRTQWYGEMPSSAKLTDGAIKGLVNALGDEFTQYVEPRFAKMLNEDMTGAFEGIGATLKQTPSGAIQIVRTFPGMPADRGGVLPGDIIEAVNGVNVQGLNSTEVAAMVRGPRGTEVTLTLRRADRPRPFQVTLVRERIEIPLVSSRMVGDGSIGYISLLDFSQPASRQLEKHLREILEKQPKALILDLRDNPGGLLSQAREVGDIFLKKGVFIIERDYRGNKKVSSTTDRGIAQDIPMVVLVNGGSASAAEIVAGAMQDTGRATLIGERTFGKGSVQSPQTLSNGGQLRITIERWYTPNDRAIHGVGITPDYIVSNSPEDARDGKDPQLEAAIEFLTSGKTPPPTPFPTVAPTPLP